jgi:hypothetical protein
MKPKSIEYIALMGDQGSWSGAAAIYNKVLVGSLNGIAAAAINYLGGAASKE